jgi:hypothetical protein
MASLPDVIGLLYRADWTRLSLSAGVRFETDRDLLYRRMREAPLAGCALAGRGQIEAA